VSDETNIVRLPIVPRFKLSKSEVDTGIATWIKHVGGSTSAIRDRDHALLRVWCANAEENIDLDFVIAELKGALERATAKKEGFTP